MSKISLEPNASGAGTFTLAAPNSNTNRTLTLPDEAGTILSDASTIDSNNLQSDVYKQDNILGIVSESGGAPTGAIIERGSNSNGEFVKYADGTLICQMFQDNFDFNTEGFTDFTHPVNFVNRFPVRFASIVDAATGGTNANEGIALLGLTGANSNTRATVTTAKDDTRRTVGITVIGRWF